LGVLNSYTENDRNRCANVGCTIGEKAHKRVKIMRAGAISPRPRTYCAARRPDREVIARAEA
jgi:hypothetical protein